MGSTRSKQTKASPELELEFDTSKDRVDTETLDKNEETPKFRVSGQPGDKQKKKKSKVNVNKKITIKSRPGTSMGQDAAKNQDSSSNGTPLNLNRSLQ